MAARSCHVAVIGAGPAGALFAFLLVRMGVRVTLIERHTDFSREFRGEGMSPGGMAAMREAGLWQLFEALPTSEIRSMAMFANGRQFLEMDLAQLMPKGVPFLRLLAQSRLLELLVSESEKFDGFRLIRGAVARELIAQGGRVCGVMVMFEGHELAVPADYVVAADGRHSLARRRLGLQLEGETEDFDVVWCRIPRRDPVAPGAVYSFVTGNASGLALPAEDGQIQIGRIIPKGGFRGIRGATADAWKDELASCLPPPLRQAFDRARDQAGRPFVLDVQSGILPKWSVAGLCFIGDAAHPMSPVGAQGINVALRDAVIAANHLGPVMLAGDLGERADEAARSFETERRGEVVKIQATQRRAQRRVAKVERAARVIRLIPRGVMIGLARLAFASPTVRRLAAGGSDLSLTFKPAA